MKNKTNSIKENYRIKRSNAKRSVTQYGKHVRIGFSCLLAVLLWPAISYAQNTNQSSATVISGVAVTGFNKRLGQSVWDLGAPLGDMGFSFVFGYNPDGGSVPNELTPATPADTLLATGFDPNFSMFYPEPDPSLLNIPFRDVAVIVGEDGTRGAAPTAQDVPGYVTSRSFPNEPLTVADWLLASGKLKYKCRQDGTSKMSIELHHMIPNGVYTLWGVFTFDFDGDGELDGAAPIAFGGIPNAMVADHKGDASMIRTLSFCPTNEMRLKTVSVAWHSDSSIYGGVPELSMAGYPGGTVTHDQITFPIHVVSTLD